MFIKLKNKVRLIILDISGIYAKIYDEIYIDNDPDEINNALSSFGESKYCIVEIKY